MPPRRSSKSVTSDHVPSTSGLFGDIGQPLSMATDQQTFPSSRSGTLEIGSPQSQPPPQPRVTPSLPPRPPAFSGLRRQSRSNTHDTYTTVVEERYLASSQPSSVTPMPSVSMPSSFSQVSEYSLPAPMQPRQPAPGDGVGGFVAPTSFYYGPSYNNSNRNTADHPYQFNTIPSPQSDSGPPHYESAAVTGGIHEKVWPTYNKISEKLDDKMLDKWNKDLDTLLLFVSLISGCDCRFRSD